VRKPREYPRKPQLKNGQWSKIGQTVSLDLLPDTLTVLYDTQDIEHYREYAPIPLDTTAIAVESMDGEIFQLWFSQSSAPYFDSSAYERIL
jgi:hypothetical protein